MSPVGPPRAAPRRKPEWFHRPIQGGPVQARVEATVNQYGLHTVCREAACPNRGYCYGRGTATFLLGGAVCTRDCRFCNLTPGRPGPPDPGEPIRIAHAARKLDLDYVVLTSPTRDDLPDGLAAHFAATIMALKWTVPGVKVEVLIPDFQGDRLALDTVLEAGPDTLNHNLETVPRLYPTVRPGADYERSLGLLRATGRRRPDVIGKSGLMVGLGETSVEIEAVIGDLARAGVRVLTIGQYLAPSPDHHPVIEYHPPERFETWRRWAEAQGLVCQAGPLVRSSFGARRSYQKTITSIGFSEFT